MDGENERINIRVRTQDGVLRDFTIPKRTAIQKLLEIYCDRIGADYPTFVFLIKGERFNANLTPAQLKLKNNCVIDALLPQHGGGPKML